MEHELRETVAVSADRQIAMAPDSPPAWAADGSPPAPDCFAPVFGAKQFFSAIPCSVTTVIRAPLVCYRGCTVACEATPNKGF
jgi:hypothetical protein